MVKQLAALFVLLSITSASFAEDIPTPQPIQFDASGVRAQIDALFQAESFDSSAMESASVRLPVGSASYETFTAKKSSSPIFTEEYKGPESSWRAVDLAGERFYGTVLLTEDGLFVSLLEKGGREFIHVAPDPSGGYSLTRETLGSSSESSCEFRGGEFTSPPPPDNGTSPLRSRPLTQKNLRLYRLAVNVDRTFVSNFGSGSILRRRVVELVNQTNTFFLRKRLNISLVLTYLKEYPDRDLDLEENADLLVTEPGTDLFDVGHLLTSRNADPKAAGRASLSGACGVVGERDKGRGISRIMIMGGGGLHTFAHEIGHQFGMNHTWSECPRMADARNDDTAMEASDGASVMAYHASCEPYGAKYPLFDYEFGYSAHSIEAAMALLSQAPKCGFSSSNTASIPSFQMYFDRRVPNRTPFSFPLSNVSGKGSDFDLVAESLHVLPRGVGAEGRFMPIFSPIRVGGGTYRVDMPTTLTTDAPETPPCSRDARKWGTPGCFSSSKPTYNHAFRISAENEPGGVSYVDTLIRFSGDPFGFQDGYLKDATLTAGEKQTLWWSVGGGSIAPKVSIYFIRQDAFDEHRPLPHTFAADDYVAVAKSVANSGSYQITVPKRKGWGSFLIIPEADALRPPFIFWSRSYQFRIQCKSEQGRGPGLGGGACIGADCDCEDDPTPTPTPKATDTPTPPPGTPTQTPAATSTSTPFPTITPTATPTSGSGSCTMIPICNGTWVKFGPEVRCTVGGNPSYFDFPISYPPSWGPECNQEELLSLPYCYGEPCESCLRQRPGHKVFLFPVDSDGNGHPESECCDGYGCANPPSSAGEIVRGICVECVGGSNGGGQ